MHWIFALLIWIAMGALVGWLASRLLKVALGLGWCIVIGIAGAVIGGFVAGALGIVAGALINFLIALAAACVLLLIAKLVVRAT